MSVAGLAACTQRQSRQVRESSESGTLSFMVWSLHDLAITDSGSRPILTLAGRLVPPNRRMAAVQDVFLGMPVPTPCPTGTALGWCVHAKVSLCSSCKQSPRQVPALDCLCSAQVSHHN
jgi:hypothetical protein